VLFVVFAGGNHAASKYTHFVLMFFFFGLACNKLYVMLSTFLW